MKYILLMILSFSAYADNSLIETRYCGSPIRNTDGSIHRRSAVIAAYKRFHPCPSTGLKTGACPGWSLNHPVSLACGGCDSVSNLEWMRNDVKKIVDSYERKINEPPIPIADTAACKNEVLK